MTEKTIGQKDIQSGDLLVWSHDEYSTKSDLYLNIVEAVTRSRYGHVGIAWQVKDHLSSELMVFEATMPKIRVARVTGQTNFYVVPMGVNMTADGKNFLTSKLGYPYGLLDAIRAGLGLTVEHDNKYQCAEYCREYYLVEGIDLGERQTPKSIVLNALHLNGGSIYRVIK